MKKVRLPRLHWFFYFLIIVWLLGLLYLFLGYGLAFLLPHHHVSNSKVKGLLVRHQTWEGEINVTGDIWATPGTVVTISPGTVVTINHKGDQFNLDWLPWNLKSGINTGEPYHGIDTNQPFLDEREKIHLHFSTLNASGTKEQPIYFRSASVQPSRYDINIISAKHGVLSYTMMSHYRRFEIGDKFTIQDSVLREVGECAVCTSGGSPSIVNSIFEQANGESVLIDGGSPRITNNEFLNLSGRGVVIDPKRYGNPVVSHNIFEMPGEEALILLTGLETQPGEVSFNKFSGNSRIFIACDSQIYFNQNTILSLISFIGNGCGGTYTFGPNYWGTNDIKAVLQERITNKDRSFTLNIPTMLTVPPPGVGRTN